MPLKEYLFLPFILATGALVLGQQEKPATTGSIDSTPEGEKAGKGSGDENSGLQVTRYMPLGKPNLRVKIPQFKDGILECLMRAGEMTRVSEDDINIKQMDIEFVGEGDSEMKIELQEATYNLTDKLIRSKNRAIVRRSDFTLIGDSLDFDTENRHGRMTGRVRMVIHDSASLMKGKEPEEQPHRERRPKHVSVSDAAELVLEAIKTSKEEKREITHDQQP